MQNPKTVSKIPSPTDTPKAALPSPSATPERSPIQEWEFKITGRGTSGWMSWVKENGAWVQLRPSETSFISAVSAIEPEVMRLAFPHHATTRKAK